jgi:hypothetical protein
MECCIPALCAAYPGVAARTTEVEFYCVCLPLCVGLGWRNRALGRVDIHLSLSFHSSVVSSFEMNEYLAATDGSLPLYPLPGKLAAMVLLPPFLSITEQRCITLLSIFSNIISGISL